MPNETEPLKEPLHELEKLQGAIEEFLKLPISDAQLVPAAGELVEALRTSFHASESVQRYREVRERMGRPVEDFMAPPNFPYTLQSA